MSDLLSPVEVVLDANSRSRRVIVGTSLAIPDETSNSTSTTARKTSLWRGSLRGRLQYPIISHPAQRLCGARMPSMHLIPILLSA